MRASTFGLALLCGSAAAQPTSADGLWLSDGYGMLFEVHGDHLQKYELTTHSCIASSTARTAPGQLVFAGSDDTFRIAPGTSPETRWLHVEGAVANILLRRANGKPATCLHPTANTPVSNYQVLWDTFAEQYGFFALHGVDWVATDRTFRPRVTIHTTPDELFTIFSEMLEPLHDGHIALDADSIHRHFRGKGEPRDPIEDKSPIAEITASYLRSPPKSYCNGRLEFALLRTRSIGYLRIRGFAHLSNDDDLTKQRAALDQGLDEIFATRLAGLVIDIRMNGGGADEFGIAILSRLAERGYVAYDKSARDGSGQTPQQRIEVPASSRPGFHGPVVLLTSAHAVSAAETFTLATFGREPHIVRIGSSTRGMFSDMLVRTLPNGWQFSISNETYRTEDGRSFEGSGIPPDITVPFFPKQDLDRRRDTGLETAIDVLAKSR
jgi:hypothetical protein